MVAMASETSALELFKGLAPLSIEVESVINTLFQSFRIIEPFAYAQSDNHQVQEILNRIRGEVMNYYRSIDQSVKMADSGHSFAQDAEILCEIFVNTSQYSIEDIKNYLDDMRLVGEKALAEAKATRELFKSNRERFFEMISKIIPGTQAVLQGQKQAVDNKKAKAKVVSSISRVAFYGSAAGTAASGLAVGTVVVASGPVAVGLIVIPVMFSIATLGYAIVKDKSDSIVSTREMESKGYEQALVQLTGALEGLTELCEYLDGVESYWGEVVTTLNGLHDNVESLVADPQRVKEGKAKIRIIAMRTQWVKNKEKQMGYISKISVLQDFYPSSKALIKSEE